MAAQALSFNGARVYIVGRTEKKLQTAVHAHGRNIDGQMIALVGDVSNKDGIKYADYAGYQVSSHSSWRLANTLGAAYRKLVEEVESKEQCLHILVNNAGIWSAAHSPEGASADELKKHLFDPEDATFENWMQVYRTNTVAHYFMITAFLPLLQKGSEQQRGYASAVINISSTSGMINSSENHFPAGTCKAGTIQLTKVLVSEIARAGLKIRINSIAPGIFPSEITAKTSDPETQKSRLPEDYALTADIAARRPGNDDDMANVVLFLATNQYLFGQVIAVDGGYLLKHGTL